MCLHVNDVYHHVCLYIKYENVCPYVHTCVYVCVKICICVSVCIICVDLYVCMNRNELMFMHVYMFT